MTATPQETPDEKFIRLRKEFSAKAVELTEAWNNLEVTSNTMRGTEAYPFHRSFDELTSDILTWAEAPI